MSSLHLTQHRISVLLIDDQAFIGETIARMLAHETDIDFHYCQEPSLAIDKANELKPTVILQDLVMPDVQGLVLVKYFRANPNTKNVPLIVLSGKEEAEIKAEAFALGANDYMVKFPDKAEVLARIRYHSKGYIAFLERNEATQELEKANRLIRKTFGRYLSDEVVEEILTTPDGASLGGEKRQLTIMMADLRGFTSLGEDLPAEQVVAMINIYLEVMTEIIFKYQGTIDEFIGDAILAIFGAPVQRHNDAQRAVACALEMQLAMKTVNERNRAAGYPEVHMGIGINTGMVVVGNIGSSKRTKYGVVGRHVNLTSRIESYTVGGQTLISESTREACGELLRIDDQADILPKGVRAPITVYEVGGIRGAYHIALPEKQSPVLLPVNPPLSVRFCLLSGKNNQNHWYNAQLMQISERVLLLEADMRPDKWSNIRVHLAPPDGAVTRLGQGDDEPCYAKITQIDPQNPRLFHITLTSISLRAEALIAQYIQPQRTEVHTPAELQPRKLRNVG